MLCLRWVLCCLTLVLRVLFLRDVSAAHKNVQPEGGKAHSEFQTLYIMDPNSEKCFEEVSVDTFTLKNLLSWVRELRDELTRTEENHNGRFLKVSNMAWWSMLMGSS